MTSASDIQSPLGLGSGIETLRAKRGWIIALGIIYVIAGLIALGSVVMATVVSVFVVGIMMLIAGVAEVINAFQVKSWGKFLFWFLLGVLYIVAGFVTFENPLLAAALLTLMLGVALVASGIMRIILAFSMKVGTPWIWVLLSSVITLLACLSGRVAWRVFGALERRGYDIRGKMYTPISRVPRRAPLPKPKSNDSDSLGRLITTPLIDRRASASASTPASPPKYRPC